MARRKQYTFRLGDELNPEWEKRTVVTQDVFIPRYGEVWKALKYYEKALDADTDADLIEMVGDLLSLMDGKNVLDDLDQDLIWNIEQEIGAMILVVRAHIGERYINKRTPKLLVQINWVVDCWLYARGFTNRIDKRRAPKSKVRKDIRYEQLKCPVCNLQFKGYTEGDWDKSYKAFIYWLNDHKDECQIPKRYNRKLHPEQQADKKPNQGEDLKGFILSEVEYAHLDTLLQRMIDKHNESQEDK